MRKQSVETQLRHAKSALTKAHDATRTAESRVASMMYGLTIMCKVIGLVYCALPHNDPWRPHFLGWIESLEDIRKKGIRP